MLQELVQARPGFRAHRGELNAHAFSGLYVPYLGSGSHFAFWQLEQQAHEAAHRRGFGGGDEQPAQTQPAHAANDALLTFLQATNFTLGNSTRGCRRRSGLASTEISRRV